MDRLFALIWLQLRMWRNGLRSHTGMADAVAGFGLSILALVFSLCLMMAIGAATHFVLADGAPADQRTFLFVFCYYSAFFALVVPALAGLDRAGVPIRNLAIFPLSRGLLYRLSLFASFASSSHLFWLPPLLVAFLVAVIGHGANPISWGSNLGMLTFCLLVWCHTALLVVRRIAARRSAKEILAIVTFVAIIVLSLIPSILDSGGDDARNDRIARLERVLPLVAAATSVLPPSQAADGLATAHSEDTVLAIGSFAWLLAWTAAGIALGFLFFARTLREGGAPAPARSPTSSARGLGVIDRIRWLPSAVRGVAAKELHYLLRSSVGRFNIAVAPVIMIFAGLVFGKQVDKPFLGVDPAGVLFLGAMLYTSILTCNFVFNAFAWERGGMRSYFMCPVDLRHVVVGKNLGIWLYNGILATECVIAFAFVVGPPEPSTLWNGCLTFAVALLSATLAGNFVSAAFPVSRDISKISNSPSHIGYAASLGVLALIGVVIGTLAAVSALIGGSWILTALLAVLLAVETGIYIAVLPGAAQFMSRRRDRLVEAAKVGL